MEREGEKKNVLTDRKDEVKQIRGQSEMMEQKTREKKN